MTIFNRLPDASWTHFINSGRILDASESQDASKEIAHCNGMRENGKRFTDALDALFTHNPTSPSVGKNNCEEGQKTTKTAKQPDLVFSGKNASNASNASRKKNL